MSHNGNLDGLSHSERQELYGLLIAQVEQAERKAVFIFSFLMALACIAFGVVSAGGLTSL